MTRRRLVSFSVSILMYVLLVIIVLPIVYLMSSSLKPADEILGDTAFFPKNPTLANYVEVLTHTSYLTYLRNSVVVTVSVTVLTLSVASLAAYALARYRHRFKSLAAFGKSLLFLQMFPLVLMMIPLYRAFLAIDQIGKLSSLIIASGAFAVPFATWLLMGFFEDVPIEMEESGLIDGCSRWQVFVRLVLPVSSPGIVAVGVFTFINSWSEYMMANIFVRDDAVKTLPVGLTTFIQQFGNEWGSLMAASTMTLLPSIAFLVFAQKYIVQGLTAGAVKG